MKGGPLENHQNHPKFKHKSPNSSTKESKPLKKHASSYPPLPNALQVHPKTWPLPTLRHAAHTASQSIQYIFERFTSLKDLHGDALDFCTTTD